MNRAELIQEIKSKKSFLCVGLDTDIQKIPKHLIATEDPIFEFNKAIIDATKDYAVAYKPNIAFYESRGATGWNSLEKTLAYIPKNCFSIADAKRGDIGNTAKMYAQTFFEHYPFDSVTVAPYMGSDSVLPFLAFKEKWTILLGLTSNEGAQDFQFQKTEAGLALFEQVLSKAISWGTAQNLMFVVGATKAEYFKRIRAIAPEHFLLVPGVGAQGGSLEEVAAHGINKDCGLLVNSSRGIIYASSEIDFAAAAGREAKAIQESMAKILNQNQIINDPNT